MLQYILPVRIGSYAGSRGATGRHGPAILICSVGRWQRRCQHRSGFRNCETYMGCASRVNHREYGCHGRVILAFGSSKAMLAQKRR